MSSYFKNRLKLIKILIVLSIIGLGFVLAFFAGEIKTFRLEALVLLIVFPVVLMTYFFITAFIHFIKKE